MRPQDLPEFRDDDEEVRVQMEILRETYLQRSEPERLSPDTEQWKVTRPYAFARGMLQRHRFLGLHYHEPVNEPPSAASLYVCSLRYRTSVELNTNTFDSYLHIQPSQQLESKVRGCYTPL